jgi:hypothetical protein
VTCGNTSELLAIKLRPGNAGANTATDHLHVLGDAIAQIPAAHRRHLLIRGDSAAGTHAEDRIRCAKDTGLRRLPSREFAINQAWCVALRSPRTSSLGYNYTLSTVILATAEPKRLRYRLLHTAAG